MKEVKKGEKIKKKFDLRQVKNGSVIIPKSMVKKLEKIEKKEKITL